MFLFDISNMEKEIKEMQNQTMKNDFWNDIEKANKFVAKLKQLEKKYENYRKMQENINNLIEFM